jgi:hypothetical protein
MIIDNSLYLMKIGGRPNDSTAWTSLWAAATNYSSSIDLTTTANRVIANGGYLVWRTGTAFTITATGTMEVQIVCSAAAALGTDTVLWSSGAMTHDAVEALYTANTIIWVIKLPRKFPLRYLGVAWVIGTDHLDTGTADIFITPNAPYPAK